MLSLPVEIIDDAGVTPSKLKLAVRAVPWADPLTVTVFANALGFDEMMRIAMIPATVMSFEQIFFVLVAIVSLLLDLCILY
jgi:hypothetical protein